MKKKLFSVSSIILFSLFALNVLILLTALNFSKAWYLLLMLTLPLLLVSVYDRSQKRQSIKRNYPVIGRLRYFFESIRPELRQYFFESDLDGKPFNRRQRSIVYQRAKNEKQTVAFGMQADPLQPGYEWVAHSMYPVHVDVKDLRVTIGNEYCRKPYAASILNIGAMSYGALSKTAIMSLNEGAMLGGFAHNTGEGGISQHHLCGGDLIWQIGTGYFGCRTEEGRFDPVSFKERATLSQVKMIELKLSQGAKPGHGGILPAAKNTAEIAAIRKVEPGTTVFSPMAHREFDDPKGLLMFIEKLRQLSEGKPVGFKLCIGDKKEFRDICVAMRETGIRPDFISVDGAEGGTGAAPLEFTDHLGMPLYDAVSFAAATLREFGLHQQVKIIASGKIITGFDILKLLSLGASACYSARGMMMALGCIQALVCDSGRCPTGVATQDPRLYKGLHPEDKRHRVASFHANTIEATKEIMEACGFSSLEKVLPSKFFRRTADQQTESFEEIYFPRVSATLTNFKNILPC